MKTSTTISCEPVRETGIPQHLALMLSPLELHNRAPWNNVVCAMLVYFSRDAIRPIAESTDWNLFLTSIGIGVFALATMIAHGNVRRNYWSGLNVVGGLWLVVSARLFPTDPAMLWPQICLGILTTTIALTSLANERRIGGNIS